MPARDRPARGRLLHDCLAGRTGELRAHVPDHLEARRHVLQDLGDVLADLLHRRAAVGAGAGRGVFHRLARQAFRQRPTCRAFLLLGLGCGNLRRARLPTRAVGFQLLDQELELADLRVELLGGATVLQSAKLGDEELEVLDLVVALGELRLLLDDQTLERLDVIGQITNAEHIASIASRLVRVKYPRELFLRTLRVRDDARRSVREARRLRSHRTAPVDPFEQHRELRTAQVHRTACRLRPHEAAALQALGE